MTKGIVTVKWHPPPKTTTMIETEGVRIEQDLDHPELVWMVLLENGQEVDSKCYAMGDFLDCVLEFYKRN